MLVCTNNAIAEGTQYTHKQLEKGCDYLGRLCEITKQKCELEKAENKNSCFVNYVGRVAMTQEITQDPADARNLKYAQEACNNLGKECDFVQLECMASLGSTFNSCVAMLYFEIEVAKERCGVMGYKACIERDREFGHKIMQELIIPNVNNPIKQKMWQECSHAGSYKVKSKKLMRFYSGYMDALQYMKDPILPMEGEGSEYPIQEEHYKCMKAILNDAS